MAACADSCMTSPSLPVSVSLPLPSTTVASVLRIEPPTSVQARPVTRPTSLFSWATVSRNLITPRKSFTFSGVAANQAGNCVICELHVFFVKTGLVHLLLDQELLGNLDLFRLGIAMQPQHFHAVLQCRRNRMQDVGRCHEE